MKNFLPGFGDAVLGTLVALGAEGALRAHAGANFLAVGDK